MIGKGTKLPDTDHVMRFVPWARLRKDEDENVIGVLGAAFSLRADEDSLSVNWLEYFGGDKDQRIRDSVHVLRSTRSVGTKSAYAIGNVGRIRALCEANGTTVKLIYTPTDSNPAHSEIRRIPRDDLELLELLAMEAFVDLVKNSDVPNISSPNPSPSG